MPSAPSDGDSVLGSAVGRRDGDAVGNGEAHGAVGSNVGAADDGLPVMGVTCALGIEVGEETGKGDGLFVVGVKLGSDVRKTVGDDVHL